MLHIAYVPFTIYMSFLIWYNIVLYYYYNVLFILYYILTTFLLVTFCIILINFMFFIWMFQLCDFFIQIMRTLF